MNEGGLIIVILITWCVLDRCNIYFDVRGIKNAVKVRLIKKSR